MSTKISTITDRVTGAVDTQRDRFSNLPRKQKRSIYAWLAVSPVLLWLLVYIYGAVLYNVILSFGEISQVEGLTITGVENYQQLANDPHIGTVLFNTLFLFLTIPVAIVLGLAIALLLDENFPGNHVFRAIFFLPYVTMMVAVAVVWQFMFHTDAGVINYFLLQIGIVDSPVSWLTSRWPALFAIFIVQVWKTTGLFVVIILAGLQTIPQQIYEAARVDSAGPIQRFRYLTLPLLKPTLGICVLIGIPVSFVLFDLILVITNGGPGNSTHHLLTWIYTQAFSYSNFGYGAVLSNIMVAITVTLVLIGRKIQTSQYV